MVTNTTFRQNICTYWSCCLLCARTVVYFHPIPSSLANNTTQSTHPLTFNGAQGKTRIHPLDIHIVVRNTSVFPDKLRLQLGPIQYLYWRRDRRERRPWWSRASTTCPSQRGGGYPPPHHLVQGSPIQFVGLRETPPSLSVLSHDFRILLRM